MHVSNFLYNCISVNFFIYFFIYLFISGLLSADTRETAFVNAVTSAGATYAVTQACSMGELIQCGCADRPRNTKKKKKPTNSENEVIDESWEWGGCGDNIEFGYLKAKEFMDAQQRKRNDIRTLITLHNNEAGRAVSS